jgi:FHA domain-containing protein/zinc ribbon protein
MRECQHCGEANQASSRFCVVCGTPIGAGGSSAQMPAAPVAVSVAVRSPSAPAAAAPVAPPVLAPAAHAPVMIAAAPARAPAPAPPVPRPAPHPVTPAPAPGGTGRPGPPQPGREATADFPLEGPRTLVGFLVSYDSVDIGQYWPIHQGRNVLGRQGAATGLDLEISHPTTSSLHAVLLATARPGRVLVEDTSSTNGTFVNDNVLAPGQRWELRDGDRVRFGLFDTIIKIVQKT